MNNLNNTDKKALIDDFKSFIKKNQKRKMRIVSLKLTKNYTYIVILKHLDSI